MDKRKTLKGTSSHSSSSSNNISNGEIAMSFSRPVEDEEIVKSLLTE